MRGRRTDRDDGTNTFVTTDERGLGRDGPVAESGVQVGVADTRADHLEQALARRELLGTLDAHILDLDGGAALGNDRGLHRFGDLGRHPCVRGSGGGEAVVYRRCAEFAERRWGTSLPPSICLFIRALARADLSTGSGSPVRLQAVANGGARIRLESR